MVEVDSGKGPGMPGDVRVGLKTLERENRGLRQTSEILR